MGAPPGRRRPDDSTFDCGSRLEASAESWRSWTGVAGNTGQLCHPHVRKPGRSDCDTGSQESRLVGLLCGCQYHRFGNWRLHNVSDVGAGQRALAGEANWQEAFRPGARCAKALGVWSGVRRLHCATTVSHVSILRGSRSAAVSGGKVRSGCCQRAGTAVCLDRVSVREV